MVIIGVDIDASYVFYALDELFRRTIGMDFRKRWVGAYKMAVRSYLENSFHGVLIDIPVLFLRLFYDRLKPFPFSDVPDINGDPPDLRSILHDRIKAIFEYLSLKLPFEPHWFSCLKDRDDLLLAALDTITGNKVIDRCAGESLRGNTVKTGCILVCHEYDPFPIHQEYDLLSGIKEIQEYFFRSFPLFLAMLEFHNP